MTVRSWTTGSISPGGVVVAGAGETGFAIEVSCFRVGEGAGAGGTIGVMCRADSAIIGSGRLRGVRGGGDLRGIGVEADGVAGGAVGEEIPDGFVVAGAAVVTIATFQVNGVG
jgi:hypothetical protein